MPATRRSPAPAPPARRQVVIGILGTVLDAKTGSTRFAKWRPTYSLTQQTHWRPDRIELLYDQRHAPLAALTAEDIRGATSGTEVNLTELNTRDPWSFEEVYGKLYDFAKAYPFDPEAEDYLIHITTGTHVAQICLFLLTESRHMPGRLLQTAPPRKDDGGPGSMALIDLDLSRYDLLASRFEREQREVLTFLKGGIETKNPAFNRMIAQIEQVAVRSTAPVLLTGPTGAGKSHLARRIYELRKASGLKGAFVEVNCATLRGDTAMSTLFGHRRGAFTGAQTDRSGLLREADRGLLFLDEIGELGPDEQAMLLRAVEDKTFLPLGSDTPVQSDFQLIAGTNRDLREDVAAGRFREDLLARLNLWTFLLPGLRERPEDLGPNIDYELERYAARENRRVQFNREARQKFLAFATGPDAPWRANFRDLHASITRMATLAPRARIDVATVDEEIVRLRTGWHRPDDSPAGQDDAALTILDEKTLAGLDLFDRMQLAAVARICRECRSASDAGRRLFAASRAKKDNPNDADRLRKFLARFGLKWTDIRSP